MDNYTLKNGIYRLNDEIACPQGALQLILRDGKTGKIKDISYYKNMFVTTGKQALADALRGNVASNRGQITYMELGTSSVAPALADTGLKAAVFRKLISVRSVSANVASFQTFFSTSDVAGVLREAGLYGDGATSQLLSGTLFCRTAINRTKTANDTLTITWNVTIG